VNKFWREATWAAQTCISFSAFHSHHLNVKSSPFPTLLSQKSELPSFMLIELECGKLEHMEGNWLVNPQMIRSIASLASQLISFDLSDCLGLSHSAFACLNQLSHLQHLSLARTAVNNADCIFISQLIHLQSLNLLGCCVGDVGVTHLSSLINMKHLFIGGPWYHSNGVARLPSTLLTVSSWQVIGTCMLQLATLVIRSVPMSAESHSALSQLTKLKVLWIWLGLDDSPDLTPLMASGGSFALEAPLDLNFIAEMNDLEQLRLDTLKHLTREGALKGLAQKTKLQTLLIPQCSLIGATSALNLGEVNFPYIQHLNNLKHIACQRCALSSVQIIEAFPILQRLDCADGFDIIEEEEEEEEDVTMNATTHSRDDSTLDHDFLTSNLNPFEITHHVSPPIPTCLFGVHHDPKTEWEEIDSYNHRNQLWPIFQIPSLTQLDLDLSTTCDFAESILASYASLKFLSLYDDEEEEVRQEPIYDLSAKKDVANRSRLPPLPQLASLVSYTASQRPTWTQSILQTFSVASHLTFLSLSTGNSAQNFPPTFDFALQSLSSLESLELRNFKHIASLSCIPLLTHLRSLYIVGLYPDDKCSIFSSISQSTSLLRLGFTYSSEISDADLRTIVKRMNQLEELDLTSLQRITDRTLHRLSKPGKGLKNLITIKLKYCPHITPDGILSLANLRRLYHIETTVQSRYLYSQDQSQIDVLFSKLSSSFVSTN
jgi:hypothetical protein